MAKRIDITGASVDLIGQKFNRWTVIKRAPDRNYGNPHWWCQCDCGRQKIVRTDYLKKGRSKSCGCYRTELSKQYFTTHGMRKSKEYCAWLNARRRCYESTNKRYADYGGRGITMSNEWKNDFSAFFKELGPCPKGYTLDRINNNLGYFPGNVRWVTPREQRLNQRPRRPYTKNQLCPHCGKIFFIVKLHLRRTHC